MLRGIERGGHLFGLADVADHRRDPAADIRDCLRPCVEVLLFAARDDDAGAETCEFDCDGLAEPRPGASDQYGYGVEGAGREGAGSNRWWCRKSGHGSAPPVDRRSALA